MWFMSQVHVPCAQELQRDRTEIAYGSFCGVSEINIQGIFYSGSKCCNCLKICGGMVEYARIHGANPRCLYDTRHIKQ